ncbi:hypothetical protein ANCDUO_21917, partial [Ancylostoma duodenale]
MICCSFTDRISNTSNSWGAEFPEIICPENYGKKHGYRLGSHDSGATETLNPKLPVANDESASIRRIGKAPCVRRGIKRWAVTQSYSIREQLDNGVRYLDLRVSYPPKKVRESNSDFRLIHALYGPKLQDVLEEIVDFLKTNTKE